jgi:hypothetical protein
MISMLHYHDDRTSRADDDESRRMKRADAKSYLNTI